MIGLVVVICALVGTLFHMFFSLALSILASVIFFNSSNDLALSLIILIFCFSMTCLLKYIINSNIQDGVIDFDVKKIKEI